MPSPVNRVGIAKPILAVTMGDPTGTGPELITKALHLPEIHNICRPVVIGDASILRAAAHITQAQVEIRTIKSPAEVDGGEGCHILNVLDLQNINITQLVRGQESPAAGHAAYEYICRAVELTKAGDTHAIVTSAINKAALNAAGHKFDGHTGLLADLFGNPKVTMMLASDNLRVFHVSTHVSLFDAIMRVRENNETHRIESVIKIAAEGIRELGIENPRIAVAALNPHAGEGGLFGTEEIEFIAPAIERAKEAGFNVSGPWPGDTVCFRAKAGDFDGVIAMYHDEGHAPIKMLGWRAVNVTLGLPIIRTSVDHGTDFPHAGTGEGDPISLVCALQLAATIAKNRLDANGSAIRPIE